MGKKKDGVGQCRGLLVWWVGMVAVHGCLEGWVGAESRLVHAHCQEAMLLVCYMQQRMGSVAQCEPLRFNGYLFQPNRVRGAVRSGTARGA